MQWLTIFYFFLAHSKAWSVKTRPASWTVDARHWWYHTIPGHHQDNTGQTPFLSRTWKQVNGWIRFFFFCPSLLAYYAFKMKQFTTRIAWRLMYKTLRLIVLCIALCNLYLLVSKVCSFMFLFCRFYCTGLTRLQFVWFVESN